MYTKTKQWLLPMLRRSSEKHHIDLIYLLGGGFWLTVTQLFTYLGSFILAVVFANFVEPEVYGNYNYLLSLFGLFSLFSLPGVDTAITQSVAKGLENSYYTGYSTKMRWSALSSLCLVFTGGYYLWFTDMEVLSIPLFMGAIITPLMYGSQIFTAFFAGRRLFAAQTKARIGVQLLSYVTTVMILLFTHNLIILILVYLLSNALGNYYFYQWTIKNFKPNRKDDTAAMAFGKHLSLLQALNIGTSYIDRFLIFNFLGPVELAVYLFALNPVLQGSSAFQNLGHLLLPKFSEKTMADIDKKFLPRLFQLLGFGVLLTVGYWLVAPWVFKVFFPKYLHALGYSQLFALTLIFQPMSPYLGSIFRSQKLTKSIYISGASTQIVLLGMLLVFGYYFQSEGVIWARVLSNVYALGLSLVLWRSEMRKLSLGR